MVGYLRSCGMHPSRLSCWLRVLLCWSCDQGWRACLVGPSAFRSCCSHLFHSAAVFPSPSFGLAPSGALGVLRRSLLLRNFSLLRCFSSNSLRLLSKSMAVEWAAKAARRARAEKAAGAVPLPAAGAGRGRGPGGRGAGAPLPADCFVARCKDLKASGGLFPGSLASECVARSATHVAVNFTGVQAVASVGKMAAKVGCKPHDRCWAIGMCKAPAGTYTALSLCEDTFNHTMPGGSIPVAHQFPPDFLAALTRGNFRCRGRGGSFSRSSNR